MKGYILLEVLVALLISSFLVLSVLHWQVASLQVAVQQFQKISMFNEARNLLEHFRADPLNREQEFKQWKMRLSPNWNGSYQCDGANQCEVVIQWNQIKASLAAWL